LKRSQKIDLDDRGFRPLVTPEIAKFS